MNGICYQYNLPDPLLLLKNPPSQKRVQDTSEADVLDYELNKASIQAKYLSGRFRTEDLLAIFSNSNSEFVSCIPRQKLLVTSTII